ARRAAVAPAVDWGHPGADLCGDRRRPVGAAVVGSDDLGFGTLVRDRLTRLADAGGKRLHLVEAGHHERELHRRLRLALSVLPWALGDAHGRCSVTPWSAVDCQPKKKGNYPFSAGKTFLALDRR